MKKDFYDVIIIGAGVAGTSLAHNLSKLCPEKSILIIEKRIIGRDNISKIIEPVRSIIFFCKSSKEFK